MSRIDESSYIPPAYSTTANGGGTSDENEATQMKIALTLILDLIYLVDPSEKQNPDLTRSITKRLSEFTQEMQQKPIPLKEMAEQYNSILKSTNEIFSFNFTDWHLNEDKTDPGKSFMQWLLEFSQQVAGKWGNDPKMQEWVTKIANYNNTGPWNANSVNFQVQAFFQDFNKLGKDTNGATLPPQLLPPNLFN